MLPSYKAKDSPTNKSYVAPNVNSVRLKNPAVGVLMEPPFNGKNHLN
jgi:hypothetical protein